MEFTVSFTSALWGAGGPGVWVAASDMGVGEAVLRGEVGRTNCGLARGLDPLTLPVLVDPSHQEAAHARAVGRADPGSGTVRLRRRLAHDLGGERYGVVRLPHPARLQSQFDASYGVGEFGLSL